MRSACVSILVLFGLSFAASGQDETPPPPCSADEYQQWDFWVGDWDVTNYADGAPAGHNTIEKVFNGCALHESWSSASGNFSGSSYNTYDVRRKVWHQTWVDTAGQLLLLEGGIVEGNMVLSQKGKDREGKPIIQRITWTPLDTGQVRQHWQYTRDGGETWEDAFDGLYTRVKK